MIRQFGSIVNALPKPICRWERSGVQCPACQVAISMLPIVGLRAYLWAAGIVNSKPQDSPLSQSLLASRSTPDCCSTSAVRLLTELFGVAITLAKTSMEYPLSERNTNTVLPLRESNSSTVYAPAASGIPATATPEGSVILTGRMLAAAA